MNDILTGALEAVGTLAFPVEHAPVALRVAVGLVAALVTFAGGRLGRHGLRLAVLVAGALAAVAVMQATDAPPRYLAPHAYAGIALLGAAAALWVEWLGFRAALFVVGLVAGAVYGVSIRETFGLEASPWWAGVGSVVVGAALPWVFETLPRVLAPAVGATGLAWAIGWPGSLPLLVGAWGVGLTVQLFTGPSTVDLEELPVEPLRAFR